MAYWGFEKLGRAYEAWPKNAAGEPVAPAFFQHVDGSQLNVDLVKSLLEAYDIPVFCAYTNDGELGKVILGQPGTGTDLYVPSTMLEDAQNILCGDIEPSEEEADEDNGKDGQ